MVQFEQLESVVALLLDNRPRAAVLAWNSLHLQPALQQVKLAEDGESLELITQNGQKITLPLDNVIDELTKLVGER